MSSVNRELITIAHAKSKAKNKCKLNFSPSIEAYCVRMGWCSKSFDGYAMKYTLRSGFTPNQAHVRQAVADLSK